MIITLVSLVIMFVGFYIVHKNSLSVIGFIFTLLGISGTSICVLFILLANCRPMKLSTRTELQEKYNTYISQIYSNNGSKNIVMLSSEIAEYNATIKTNRELQNDIWVGWFIPDFYDDMPIIEVKV